MRRLAGALALSMAAAIWGGMYVVSKVVLGYVPPLTLVTIRLAIAVAVLAAFILPGGRWRVHRRDLPLLAAMGLVGYTVSISAQFFGTAQSSAHNGALITSASPAFIVIFAAWLLRERITWPKLAAVALASAGVLLIVGRSGEEQGPNVLLGNIWLLAAAVSWALFTVLTKISTRRYSSQVASTYAFAFGFLFTLPLSRLEPAVDWGSLSAGVWWGIGYLGVISTAVAMYLWALGFQLLDAGSGAVFFFVQPVVGALLGWLLLGEKLHLTFFVGGALIFAGVTLATLVGGQRAAGADA